MYMYLKLWGKHVIFITICELALDINNRFMWADKNDGIDRIIFFLIDTLWHSILLFCTCSRIGECDYSWVI